MPNTQFNNRLRQVILLLIIALLVMLLLKELYLFLPGFLGAVTLYILTRKWFQHLTIKKKWNKGLTAGLFIIGALIIIAIPIYFSIRMISPKINSLLNDKQEVMQGLEIFSNNVKSLLGINLFTDENAKTIAEKASSIFPLLINSTALLLTNLIMLFFVFYYILVNGLAIEKYISKLIPLKSENVDKLGAETVMMVRANAIGIPLICLIQGIFAAIGYLIFGIQDWGMWGFVTGVFAFFPLLGTMVVWIPLVIYLFSTGNTSTAIWLTLYSLIITGNVDYIARMGLLKRMGNVHPMITVCGVIVGLSLFGFMGLIFGPLLVSYCIILAKIYMNEFVHSSIPVTTTQAKE